MGQTSPKSGRCYNYPRRIGGHWFSAWSFSFFQLDFVSDNDRSLITRSRIQFPFGQFISPLIRHFLRSRVSVDDTGLSLLHYLSDIWTTKLAICFFVIVLCNWSWPYFHSSLFESLENWPYILCYRLRWCTCKYSFRINKPKLSNRRVKRRLSCCPIVAVIGEGRKRKTALQIT